MAPALPAPVSAARWTAETVDQHVAEVRALFLETLGQAGADEVPLKRVK